jgi:hypothetical protein
LRFAEKGGPIFWRGVVSLPFDRPRNNPRKDATPDDPTKPKRARSVTVVNRFATWVRALVRGQSRCARRHSPHTLAGWTPVGRTMMRATPDSRLAAHGHRGLAAEPGPREL